MPKYTKTSLIDKMYEIAEHYTEITTNGQTLMCNICDKTINSDIKHVKSRVKEHIATSYHLRNQLLKVNLCQKQNFLLNTFDKAMPTIITDNNTHTKMTTSEDMVNSFNNINEIVGQNANKAMIMAIRDTVVENDLNVDIVMIEELSKQIFKNEQQEVEDAEQQYVGIEQKIKTELNIQTTQTNNETIANDAICIMAGGDEDGYGYVYDNDLLTMEKTIDKKRKYFCIFKDYWLSNDNYKEWLNKCDDMYKAKCLWCKSTFTIKYDGVKAINCHKNRKKHINNEKIFSSKSSTAISLDIVCEENKKNNDIINSNLSAKYFCIFCSHTFSDKICATRHYMYHINYYPIACLACNENLTDVQSFVTHHSELHSNELKGRFKMKKRPELDTWIELFLTFQTTITGTIHPSETSQPSQPSHLTRASCIDCPVCIKLMEANNVDIDELVLNNQYPNLLSMSVHLHQHFTYYPFECALCNATGKCVRVISRDSLAVSHLNDHKLENIIDINTAQFDEKLTEYFPQTLCIPEIENLIVSKILKL